MYYNKVIEPNNYDPREIIMMVKTKPATAEQVDRVLKTEDMSLDEIKRLVCFLDDKQYVSERAKFILTTDMQKEIGLTPDKPIQTTIGRLIFNLAVVKPIPELWLHLGYMNGTLNGRGVEDLHAKVTKLYLEETIDSKVMHNYITAVNWMGFSISSFMGATLDIATTKPSPLMKKLKKEMLADPKVKTAIATGDINAYTKSQDIVLAKVKLELEQKGTSGMDIYNSGGGGKWGNNFKNVTMGRGVIPRSDDPSKFNISTVALTDGIPRDQMHLFADLSVTASSARAIGTSSGGYIVKQFNAAFGHLVITEFEDDCKAKHGIERTITSNNAKEYYMRFIDMGKGKLLRIDEKTLPQILAIGKPVKIRSPMYCVQKGGLCGKCAGDLFRVLNTKTIGLLSSKIGSKILLQSMKQFHDMSVKVNSIDLQSKFQKVK